MPGEFKCDRNNICTFQPAGVALFCSAGCQVNTHIVRVGIAVIRQTASQARNLLWCYYLQYEFRKIFSDAHHRETFFF